MSEDKELKEQLQAIREDVADALDTFVAIYNANADAFGPLAHELRVRGNKVRDMGPNWLRRAVHYAKFAEKKRYPVK